GQQGAPVPVRATGTVPRSLVVSLACPTMSPETAPSGFVVPCPLGLPVRYRAILAAQVGKLSHLEGMRAGRVTIELDSQAGASRRQQVAILPLDLNRHHVGEHG